MFCGLPIYFELKRAGKTVHLANLSSGALWVLRRGESCVGTAADYATNGSDEVFELRGCRLEGGVGDKWVRCVGDFMVG